MKTNAAVKAVRDGSKDLGLFEEAKATFEELQKIGRFVPVFVHHPNEGVLPIYPTVPQDIGKVVLIGRGILNIIQREVDQSQKK